MDLDTKITHETHNFCIIIHGEIGTKLAFEWQILSGKNIYYKFPIYIVDDISCFLYQRSLVSLGAALLCLGSQTNVFDSQSNF